MSRGLSAGQVPPSDTSDRPPPQAAVRRRACTGVHDYRIFTRPGVPPFRLMDRVGLDVVLAIEEHYAEIRPGIPEGPRELLRRYIDEARVGAKSGRGLYDETRLTQHWRLRRHIAAAHAQALSL